MQFKGYSDDRLRSFLTDRFTVTYRICRDEQTALQMAKNICVEQTVEFPADHIECDVIQEDIIGRIEEFTRCEDGFRAVISYSDQVATPEFAQFFNVVFGNSSMLPGIVVEDISMPEEMLSWFPGPKYGIDALRERLDAYDRPLTMTALKPMGLPTESLVEEAYRCALGGIDFIKDDHGLSDQPFSEFRERVGSVCEAVDRANAETGGHTMYIPNLTGSVFLLEDRVKFAQECGAGGIMLCPGLISYDAMQYVSAHTDLPVCAHPAMAGCFMDKGSGGFDCGLILGLIPRICGADLTVFPNFGGRFSLSEEQCLGIVDACMRPYGSMPRIAPCPSGGMTFDKIEIMRQTYGNDAVFLMGGGLFTYSPDLTENCRMFLERLC